LWALKASGFWALRPYASVRGSMSDRSWHDDT
jgi:hypothetical protein